MALLFLLSLFFTQTLISSAADGPVLGVKEGEDVVLPCSINKDITSNTFEWTKVNSKEVYLYQNNGAPFSNKREGRDNQFKDRTSHFQEELSKGNASIKITETKLADSGI
ncbi:CD276 antigen homolog [Cheilinus undulatus]|uniref:CD276 antigen homolog n=1 Tax=Cheilinus undulatus TaxID=241271 RepID=UPI001BD6900C|nr:CD276 antigen homolog [Cheilinus undulatus]